MEPLISQFISHVDQCFAARSADNIVSSLPLDETHPFYGPLNQVLVLSNPATLSSSSIQSRLTTLPGELRENLSTLISALLKNIRGETDDNEVDQEERAYRKFNRLQQIYSEANKIFGLSDTEGSASYAFLNPLIKRLSQKVSQSSDAAASLSTYPLRHPKSARSIRDATRQLIERSMQIASVPMSELEWNNAREQQHAVGDIIWPLANELFRIYAQRKLHTQSTELQKSLHNLIPPEDERLTSRRNSIRATDVCQSYYWRGKLGVVLLDMRGAVFWLQKAWTTCPQDTSGWKQRRSIIIRFIAVNLLLGRLPCPTILETYDLPQFRPLIDSFRTGNISLWRRVLEEHREWFRRRSIWLVLYERGEILLWRNLFRQALKMYYQVDPMASKGRCPTWIFIAAASQAFAGSSEIEDATIEIEDIIVIVSSLIDQGLILGYLSYSHKQLVMKPSSDGMGGFPKIAQVLPRRIEAIH
ncbi:hypothetical protein C366_05935 [Cryptococcus neoformans Tu401-1]|nr:hypothetical protein AYX15_03539 [Cryptococcus neoformans var. grubii]OWZ75304.1 hypothetical protein C365_05863 [Cryptococcus neoformans var. grubii Bt85]OXG12210.1 hypothetical protein C366_05935 [Cryptococcus neoformans var. grubii Tu401-1]OXM76454.1 hypothetical protein C364_05910 [Cryptococcus neoformans var. grubii Bt63]